MCRWPQISDSWSKLINRYQSTNYVITSFSRVFFSLSSPPHSYRNGVAIQLRWHCDSSEIEPAFNLKGSDIPIEMAIPRLSHSCVPSSESLFRLLFHEFRLSCLFTFCQQFCSLALIFDIVCSGRPKWRPPPDKIIIRFVFDFPAAGGRHLERPLQPKTERGRGW